MKDLAIRAQNITKSFGKLVAVNDLSFEVPRGICFGLLGPNGAGKTTMMKILYGKAMRNNPREGDINVFGYDPIRNELEIKFLSGIVPQEDNLDLELSVMQNLMIYSRFYGLQPDEAEKRIDELLDFMALSDKKKSPIKELSGGMKRRLTIARALINSPQLLILDEPTTGLDPQVRHLIWDKLRLLMRHGVTILLTTHYMEEAYQLCDDLIIMHRGKKIVQGNPSRLIQDNMEPYVLEIYNISKINEVRESEDVRHEKTENRTLYYSNTIQSLQTIQSSFCAGDCYLRQTNLEDLFLKTTGRGLDE